MQHLHYEVNAGPTNLVQITLNAQANVQLMDSINYQRYKSGAKYQYQGGLAKASPVNLRPPCNGKWHVAVDLGGRRGSINASVCVI